VIKRQQLWALILAAAMALPVFTIVVLAFGNGLGTWPHLLSTVLPNLVSTTLVLCGLCGALALVLGTVSAWLVSFYDFPGRQVLSWMALLPLALPGYIVSFVYVDALTFSGPVQTSLRQWMGWSRPQDYWFPDIRSVGGAAVVLAFALYPYVYLAARAAFLRLPANQIHVSRTLGRSPFQAFRQIALPQARTAVFIGTLLVVIECLNDIGAATFFGVRTLTLAVYSTWLDLGNLAGAAQLALLLVFTLGTLLYVEQKASARQAKGGAALGQHVREVLGGGRAWSASLALATPILFGFILPCALLITYSLRRLNEVFNFDNLRALGASLLVAGLASVFTLMVALAMVYVRRHHDSPVLAFTTRLASLGYALPGAVLGLGLLVPFGQFDQAFNGFTKLIFGWTPGLILSGGIFTVVFAYVVRFLIIALSNVGDGMDKIPVSLDHVSRTLGRSPFRAFWEIQLPLLKPAIIAAGLLVMVDSMKELPATLILRPFDFDTLATRIFSLASLGQYESAAIPALAIVMAGLLPVIVLSKSFKSAEDS
jgi:iron(III) transport system permease protein